MVPSSTDVRVAELRAQFDQPRVETGQTPGPVVPRDTSPTWELELLISGAVLWALLQLPALLTRAYDALEQHLASPGGAMLAFMGVWYARAALVTLILCFVLHLVARAYWVGLVGLHSVFPAGPRWEKSKFGPVTRELYRERLPALPAMIARVDNVCSVIFSFAFLIVMLFLMSIVIVGPILGLSALAGDLLGSEYQTPVYFALLSAVFAGPVLLRVVDSKRGATAVPGSALHRRLRRVGSFYFRLQLFALYGSVLTTLFSNVRGRVIYPLFFTVLALSFATAIGHTLVRDGLVRIDSLPYFDDDGSRAVRSVHYESQWAADEGYVAEPSIQSDVVTGSYLKLFVPYLAERHTAAVARLCPAAPALGGGGIRFGRNEPAAAASTDTVLACLRSVLRPAIDGRELPRVDFQFHTHPRSGARGVLAYIPVDSLARGRHLLTVQRTRRARTNPTTPTRPPYEIAFWR